MKEVNNWTKPRDLAAGEPPGRHPPAAARSFLPLEGICPVFMHTGWAPDVPREVSQVFSCYKPNCLFCCREGLQAHPLQDHCWQGRVNKENSIMNLIQISGIEWTKQKMRNILQYFIHYLLRLCGLMSTLIPEEMQASCDSTQLTLLWCVASCLYKFIFT